MSEEIWYYEKNGKAEGPVSESGLTDLIVKEEIKESTLVWQKPMKEWAKASSVESLKQKFISSPPPLPGDSKAQPPVPKAENNPFSAPKDLPIQKKHTDQKINQKSGRKNIPQVRPWHRLFAREVDYTIFGILLGIGIYCFEYYGIFNSNYSYNSDNIYTSDNISTILQKPAIIFYIILIPLFITLLWTFIEAFLLSRFGTTPGKYILGIKVLDSNGRLLDYDSALNRSYNVWLKGIGMNIPIVNLVAMFMAYDRMKIKGVTSWYEKGDYQVKHGTFNELLAITVLVLFLVYWLYIR